MHLRCVEGRKMDWRTPIPNGLVVPDVPMPSNHGQRESSIIESPANHQQATSIAPAMRIQIPEPPCAQNPLDPVAQPEDPRLILARRTVELLEGEILRPEKREQLMKLGRVLGLSAFDATLVIAILQDRARRGISGTDSDFNGQLLMIGKPTHPELGQTVLRRLRLSKSMLTLILLILILLAQAIAVWHVLH